MSSTAAQRSVADYKAAGLNPALAYDRPASAMSGASTSFGNAGQAGVASAQQFQGMALELARTRQQMSIDQVQSNADAQVKAATALNLASQTARTDTDRDFISSRLRDQLRETSFRNLTQPFDLRQAAAQARISELSLPGAENRSRFDRATGMLAPAVSLLHSSASAFSAAHSAYRGFDDF